MVRVRLEGPGDPAEHEQAMAAAAGPDPGWVGVSAAYRYTACGLATFRPATTVHRPVDNSRIDNGRAADVPASTQPERLHTFVRNVGKVRKRVADLGTGRPASRG
jgi:hypothetical protein